MAIVAVRRGHGRAVLIGPSPAGPAGVAVLGVPGGEVHVDPAAPDEPPFAVLHDPAAALPSVSALYGPEVAAAVLEPDDPAFPEARPGPLDPDVRTAGMCRWLTTYSPDQLPAPLLDIEGALARSRPGFSDGETEDAGRRLHGQAERLVAMSRRLRERDVAAAPPGLADLVVDAVDAAIAVVRIGTPLFEELDHERDLVAALRHLGLPVTALSWAELESQPGFGDRRRFAATDASDGRTGSTEMLASVDWLQVPRGVLATAEDGVRMRLIGSRVMVTVAAAPGAPDHRGLAFRVYAEGRPMPVTRGALRLSPDGRQFAGEADLPSAGAGRALAVDVYDTSEPRRPRIGVAATAARAERWAARAVSLVRLGGPDADSSRLAAAAFDEAQNWWGVVVSTHPDTDHGDLARRRQARCAALRRAALVRIGQVRQAEVIGRRWRVGAAVTEADVAVPDLSGPGWRPVVAERALTVDPGWWR